MNLPLITSGFKIAYSHESAIFCTVWQHTNLLFLQLLDYTTVGQIPFLCVIFLRTGNASETFLGFCMEFLQSAVGVHPDAAGTRGSHRLVQLAASMDLIWLLFTQPHGNGLHFPCDSKEWVGELLLLLPLSFSSSFGTGTWYEPTSSSLHFCVLGKCNVVSFFPVFIAAYDTCPPNLFCHHIQCPYRH